MPSLSQHRDLDYTFAKHFATLRTALGLTQSALAQRLGITERAIQRWEGGTRYPKVEYLKPFLALCIQHHALPAGQEVEQARTLWKAAQLKVLFEEHWVQELLNEQSPPSSSAPKREVAPMPQSLAQPVDWGEEVSDVSFYGRESEQAQLTTWIRQDRCRLIALLGMGGIGKSALAVTLLHQLAPSFSVAVFRSVRDAIPCEELLADLIQALAAEPLNKLPVLLSPLITLLLDILQKRRCLLVLDNVETLLQEGEQEGHYRAGYQGYARLFERIATTQHQSSVLLTSREKPAELKPLEGSHSPVRSLRLSGLDEQAGTQILREKHLCGESAAMQRLIEVYSGNPLALKLVAATIRDLFVGEIAPFLAEGHIIFQGVRALLDQQFARLPFLAQSVLFWLAILREPVDVSSLLSRLVTPVPRLHVLEALEDLRRRSLVEHGPQRSLFTLQSVVMEYVTDALVKQMALEVQRQEPDYLLTYALSLASTKEYIRQTQERLLLAPILLHLGATQHRKGMVEHHLLHGLDQLRLLDLDKQGYGPTNIAMLLRYLKGHLRGIDLSRCALREASLQGIWMQDARLAYAAVRDSVFMEPLDATTAVTISKNGQCWAAASWRGEVRVWTETCQTLHSFWQAHITNVFALSFSPDGRRLASGGWDCAVKLWDVESGTLLWTGWHSASVNGLAFEPGGRLLASGGDDTLIRLWDPKTGRQMQQLASQGGTVQSLAWSPDGRRLASGHADGSIWMWEPEMPSPDTHAQRLAGHSHWVTGLCFSPDGAQFASCSFDGTVKLWDVESRGCRETLLGHTDRVMRVAWSPDGHTLVSGGWDCAIYLWDVRQGRVRAILHGLASFFSSLAFTPDSRTLLSSGGGITLGTWDVERGQCIRLMRGMVHSLCDIDWSPDGRLLAGGGVDRDLTLWEVAPVASQRTLRGHREGIQGVAWSPDGRLVASAGIDNRIGLWDPTTGTCLEMLRDPDAVETLFLAVAFSPDGRTLACGTFLRGVQVWDVAARTRCWVGQTQPPTRIHRVAWSPDGARLVGAGWDGTVYVWDARDGSRLARLAGHNGVAMSVAWSPDGNWLASAGGGREGGELFVWQAQSGERVRALAGHDGAAFAVVWSPCGKRLVSGGTDGRLCWWEVESGECLRVREAHQGMVYALKVSPDGGLLASCGDDGAIHLWDLDSGKHLQTLRQERLYERLDITGIEGITEAQKTSLRALGAVGV